MLVQCSDAVADLKVIKNWHHTLNNVGFYVYIQSDSTQFNIIQYHVIRHFQTKSLWLLRVTRKFLSMLIENVTGAALVSQ